MPSFNKVILCGRLTKDPELSDCNNGSKVVDFSIAINRVWKNDAGEKQEEVCYVDCVAYRRLAENISGFFNKGRPILVEGRLDLDRWEDKENGRTRSRLRVHVEKFEFLDSKISENEETCVKENGVIVEEVFDTI